jgi:prepilin-type N-terminal cleavage/methylation domain-containing protein
MRRKDQKGFTLMELMVVIVIVAILAAVAVPLYINYVRDAQRTEAKGAIAAIVTAEQVHLQRYGVYLGPYTNTEFLTPPADPEDRLEVDIREALANWTITVTVTDPIDAFTIRAENVDDPTLTVTYTHSRTTPPASGPWTDT